MIIMYTKLNILITLILDCKMSIITCYLVTTGISMWVLTRVHNIKREESVLLQYGLYKCRISK